jgi:hypothetical protein
MAFLVTPTTLRGDGTKCEDPLFGVAWESFDELKLTAFTNADQDEEFCLYLSYLRQLPEGPASPELLTPAADAGSTCAPPAANEVAARITATEDGASLKLALDRATLLRSGGFLGFRFLPPTGATTCEARRAGPADHQLKVLDKHELEFDLGSVMTLDGDGTWSSAPELAASFRSRWKSRFLAGVLLRYSEIGSITEAPEEDEQEEEEDGETTKEEPFDPFRSGGGTFKAEIFAVALALERAGIAGGVGFATVPGNADSSVAAKRYFYVAGRCEVEGYNSGRAAESLAGSSAWVQAGLLWDDLFEDVVVRAADGEVPELRSDESERYFLEGEFEIPRVGNSWFRLAVRAFASLPRSGDGPTDVRVSVLGSIDPTEWFQGARNGVD